MTLHAPTTYEVVIGFKVPVIDAQGVRWSPDGRWLVLWEAASAGFKVVVYTADGHLYRVYRGWDQQDEGFGGCGLGVREVEWSPGGEWLVVLGGDGRAVLLGSATVGIVFCFMFGLVYWLAQITD